VKDFVREYGKMAAFFAAGAFLLSLLIGLVSRNPFGVALLRALLSALVFAGLGAGVRFAVRTYLQEPGTEGATADGGKSETRDGRGGKVDIVLPEERPPAHQRARGGEGSSLEDSPLGSFRDVDDEMAQESAGTQADAEVMENLAEELEEELPGAAEGRDESLGADGISLGDEDLAAAGGSSEDDTGVSARSAEAGERAGKSDMGGSRRNRRGSDEDADSLPDISNLEILTDRGAGAPGARPGGAGEETPEDAVRGAVSGQDPATLARAIRTVLKRDEKG
jgi:hypothetical protein